MRNLGYTTYANIGISEVDQRHRLKLKAYKCLSYTLLQFKFKKRLQRSVSSFSTGQRKKKTKQTNKQDQTTKQIWIQKFQQQTELVKDRSY